MEGEPGLPTGSNARAGSRKSHDRLGAAMASMGIDLSAATLGLASTETDREIIDEDRIFGLQASRLILPSDAATARSVGAPLRRATDPDPGEVTDQAVPRFGRRAMQATAPWRFTSAVRRISAERWNRSLMSAAARIGTARTGSTAASGLTGSPENLDVDCPICLVALLRDDGVSRAAGELDGDAKPIVLLDCSHLYHHDCLKSFAGFCAGQGKELSCPVCRSAGPAARAVDSTRLRAAHLAACTIST